MDARLTLALLAGRGVSFASRRFGGGGTAAPGRIISRIEPHALQRIVRQLPHGAVALSGTNGKTTTARMVAHVASATGFRPIHNRSGANLITGILSAVAAQGDLRGRPSGDIGVFEVDEAHVPAAVDALAPRVLALTNVFRDQLDRYGEVDLVAHTWRKAIHALDSRAVLVLNVDDPIVAQLADAAPCRVLTFGVDDESVGEAIAPHEADTRLCPRCGHRMAYRRFYYGHMGHYQCPACGWRRPHPDLAIVGATNPVYAPQSLAIAAVAERVSIHLPLAGLYNAYNALAAASICTAIGISARQIADALSSFTAAFGRQERIPIGAGSLVVALVKNPVGFNQVLRTVFSRGHEPGAPEVAPRVAVIAINDLLADGTDVSWLWDVDFEILAADPPRIICTGLRAEDLALRLKYAMVPLDAIDIEPGVEQAIDRGIEAAEGGQPVAVFPTYTAMLATRRWLHHRGLVAPFWED